MYVQGAFLNYMYQYISNEQATKADIAATLSVSKPSNSSGNTTDGGNQPTTNASLALQIKRSLATKGVNIVSSIRTNAKLPVDQCGELVVSVEFDADKARACIKEWLKEDYPPEAAYSAYAMPFEYHPTFQSNLPAWDTTPMEGLGATDEQYTRSTGLLRMRLNQIKAGLGSYPMKADQFYRTVQLTIEEGVTAVTSILDDLRTGAITSFDQWWKLYSDALAKVNLASSQAVYTPAGGRSGAPGPQRDGPGLCVFVCPLPLPLWACWH